MGWVYIKTEPRLWTVGFYEPTGKWNSDSDHDHQDCAARRVSFLNGGNAELKFIPTCSCGGLM